MTDHRKILQPDQDGDWQFVCGTTDDEQDGRVISLETVLEMDASVAELAGLPRGWEASRVQGREVSR